MKKLNLGCGKDIKEDHVNLDCMKKKGVDVIHNLNKFPYPFPDNYFGEILASFIMEHVDNFAEVLKELARILKSGGKLKIIVPYDISYTTWSNYQHKRGFNLKTFLSFAKNTKHLAGQDYEVAYFKTLKQKLWFPKGLHIESYILEPLFNLAPFIQRIYEETGLRALFPAHSTIVELIK